MNAWRSLDIKQNDIVNMYSLIFLRRSPLVLRERVGVHIQTFGLGMNLGISIQKKKTDQRPILNCSMVWFEGFLIV